VWIYKGDVVPYRVAVDDKIAREAAMAVGETAGAAVKPRKVLSSAAARRKPVGEAPATEAPVEDTEVEVTPLIKPADPEFERLLAEEEEIERSTRQHHETPHFRMGDD
jgi:small subunit ribosomal protein S3